MLQPKRTKFRKVHKGRNRGLALRGSTVSFGSIALKSTERGRLTARQIEAARRAIVREMKRRGKVWIRIFPSKPYTQRPPETRMGKGKGNVEYYVAVVKPGRMMIEIAGMPSDEAMKALKMAQYKFSIKTKIVIRHEAQAGE